MQDEQFVSVTEQSTHIALHCKQTAPFRKKSDGQPVQVSGALASQEEQLELQQVVPL